MTVALVLGVLLCVPLSFAAAFDYDIRILKPAALEAITRETSKASTNLVGKSIAAIFGPIAEIRVELGGVNRTAIDGDTKKVGQRIRERIDRAKCLGRDLEVAWHKAPWIRGHILLKNGRILPLQILLSGIVVEDLLFAEDAVPNVPTNRHPPIRSGTNRTSPPAVSRR